MTTPELPPLPPLSAQCFWFLSEEGADQVRGYAEAYARTALAPLEAEVAAMRKDAERWRWLTEDCDGNAQCDFQQYIAHNVDTKKSFDAMVDAAIDSAMNTKGESA